MGVQAEKKKQKKNFNVILFLETTNLFYRTLKLGLMVVYDKGFPKI